MQKTQNIIEEGDQIELEDVQFYNEIDKLETSGINVADITKLKQAGKSLNFFNFLSLHNFLKVFAPSRVCSWLPKKNC
jgi:hypothetical protein